MRATTSTVDDRAVKLAGIVLVVHLVANGVHSVAHVEIPVLLQPAPTAVVVAASYVLPVLGVALLWSGYRKLGGAVFAASMAVAFTLGVFLHFLVPNPDNVVAIPAGGWQLPFQLTAVALAVTDAVGGVLGGWLWWTADGEGDRELPRSGRIKGVPDAGFRPLARLAYWVSRRWLGDVPEPVTIAAHHRHILSGANAYELALASAGHVDERLKELAVLKAATTIGCEFCVDLGAALGAEIGIDEEQLRALPQFEDSDAFSAVERLVLRYAVAMSRTPADVPDELFDALAEEFDEPELVELTAAIAWENYRGRFNQAFGVDAQGFREGAFCPRPDRPAARGRESPARARR